MAPIRCWHGSTAGSSCVPRSRTSGDIARLTLRDSTHHDWRVASVTAPVWRVLWLDTAVTADDRKALKRAFNDASMYSDDSRIAMAPRRTRPRSGFVLTVFHRP